MGKEWIRDEIGSTLTIPETWTWKEWYTQLDKVADAIAKEHEQELDELKSEMGKAQDLLGAAYGLLRDARGAAKEE